MHTRAVTSRLVFNALTLTVLAASTAGCGQQLCTVTGRVAFQGQPVTSGSVVLYCEGQQIVRGLIGPDGTYAIPNVHRGPVRVTVKPPDRMPAGFRKKYAMPPVINGPIMPEVGMSAKDSRNPVIPVRYGMPEESGLTVTVDSGVTEFDINLTR
jgi:hypothetical protein